MQPGREEAEAVGGAGTDRRVSLRRLDDLVTQVAVAFMPATAATLQATLEETLRELAEFFNVDTSFLRHNDFERDVTVLVAEWPIREHIPTPDPLGVVPFGVDPVFDATRTLADVFVIRPTPSSESYQERVQQGAGVDEVSMAMVPLIRGTVTDGVLGFIKFGDRPWDVAETNALQAVASLIVQLQARVEAEERLLFQAFHDELTNLPNRRGLLQELERRREIVPHRSTVLLFLDLDRFKTINDSLGHAAGDRLLTAVAERLRAAEGDEGFVSRLAGDEFVLLVDGDSGRVPLEIAEELLHTVSQPIDVAGHHITRVASIGIASSSASATDDDLLTQAEAAFRLAKRQGGNRAVVFDARLRAEVKERSDIEVLLRAAIDDGNLLLHYQPEIDLRTGQLLAVEALVRWNHPERGLLAAGSFITVAEESGLIIDLGQWVMAEACRQMAVWRVQFPTLRMMMRVNMSPAQLTSRNIVSLVADRLKENGLPGHLLCLEITEHAVMQDIEQSVRTLLELKALGVHLAMDDFGTGFSSMAQLKNLPFDTLKIDQAFVAGLATDHGDRAIVDATVRLATSFGLDVVAEGVETVELVCQLLALGCNRAQGYLLSRPKPPAELNAVLARGGLDPATFTDSTTAAGPGQNERKADPRRNPGDPPLAAGIDQRRLASVSPSISISSLRTSSDT